MAAVNSSALCLEPPQIGQRTTFSPAIVCLTAQRQCLCNVVYFPGQVSTGATNLSQQRKALAGRFLFAYHLGSLLRHARSGLRRIHFVAGEMDFGLKQK